MTTLPSGLDTIRLPERGSVDVSAHVWQKLARSSSFWALVEREVVQARQVAGGKARLLGGCYVGRSQVAEDLVLEVHEKVSGSLSALLDFAYGSDFRIERLCSPSTDLGDLVALLVSHFVEATRKYAARGREFGYVTKPMRGSLVGGRLDVTRTLRLHARGLRHLAAFEKNAITFDLPVNRVLLAALREVDRLQALIPIPPDIVVKARGMAMVFDDCRGPEVLFGRKADMVDQADRLCTTAKDRVTSDLMALAAIILSNESFEQDAPQRGIAPRAWFLNLETLFEKAVREAMSSALQGVATVTAGRSKPAKVFTEYQNLRANPDLVVRRIDTKRVMAGDVKYKRWSGSPKAADVYQLLVHASAFNAQRAFLIYPGDSFETVEFGTASTGAAMTAYTLDVRDLPCQIARLLGDLDMIGVVTNAMHGGTAAAAPM